MKKDEETLQLLREQKIRDQNNQESANQVKRVGVGIALVGFWGWVILFALGGEFTPIAPLSGFLIPVGVVVYVIGWLKAK